MQRVKEEELQLLIPQQENEIQTWMGIGWMSSDMIDTFYQ